jgi:hypothetical protein
MGNHFGQEQMMTTEVRNILVGLLVAILLLICVAWRDPAFGQEANSEDLKQILRLRATEFCATVGKPPEQLRDAINNAMAQDPKTWMPIALWWNRIAERYEKAGCGDA